MNICWFSYAPKEIHSVPSSRVTGEKFVTYAFSLDVRCQSEKNTTAQERKVGTSVAVVLVESTNRIFSLAAKLQCLQLASATRDTRHGSGPN